VITQREDLWVERACQAVVDRLATEDVWVPVLVTEPRPYLPESDELADVGVHYVVTRVV